MNTLFRIVVTAILGTSCLIATGCTSCGGSGLQGTYSDAAGSTLLELKSGGKANFTWMGQIADCTYTSSGTQVKVSCQGDAGTTVFNVHDDGSLTGPPGSFIPVLTKRKS